MKLRTLVNSNRTLQGRGVMQQWAEGKKKNTHFSLSQALKVYSLLPLAGGAN